MAERIDLLIPWVPADNSLPFFTVDTNVPYVMLQPSPGTWTLYNGARASIFAKGDSFVMLSAGIVMPLSFQVDRSINPTYFPYIGMILSGVGKNSGASYYFQEISAGALAYIYLPAENYDTPFDIYMDLPNEPPDIFGNRIINEPFSLLLVLNPPDLAISMAGVPGSLQGTVQCVTPYIKISHTLPLTI